MFSCVHQGNLRVTPAPSNLTKYAQKTLCTKTPLSRGVTGKTFSDTEKKNKERKKGRNETQIPTGFGNPVIMTTVYRGITILNSDMACIVIQYLR